MTGLIIVMILIGCLFVAASFMVSEKLSERDVEAMKEVTKSHIEVLIKDRMADASSEMEDILANKIDQAMEKMDSKTDKETVEKIMEISEYAKPVLENMEKARSEVNFIYAMLGEKQEAIKTTTVDIQEIQLRLGQINDSVEYKLKELNALSEKVDGVIDRAAAIENKAVFNSNTESESYEIPEVTEPLLQLGTEEIEETAKKTSNRGRKKKEEDNGPIVMPQGVDKHNLNMEILNMHDEGLDSVEIARRLGIGQGEVKLVLGLYLGES